MLLSVKERLLLLNVLPDKGDYTSIKIIRKLREDLSFSEKEHKEFNIKMEENGLVLWDDKAEKPKDVPIGEKAIDIIKGSLRKVNAEQQITEDLIPVYEKFVLDE